VLTAKFISHLCEVTETQLQTCSLFIYIQNVQCTSQKCSRLTVKTQQLVQSINQSEPKYESNLIKMQIQKNTNANHLNTDEKWNIHSAIMHYANTCIRPSQSITINQSIAFKKYLQIMTANLRQQCIKEQIMTKKLSNVIVKKYHWRFLKNATVEQNFCHTSSKWHRL